MKRYLILTLILFLTSASVYAKVSDFIPQGIFAPKGFANLGEKSREKNKSANNDSLYYYYAGGYKWISCLGVMVEFSIHKPFLSNLDAHSLCELAVQSEDLSQIVEVGWTISPGINNNSFKPHLFVFHWINSQPTCYNGCGWVQISSKYYPGIELEVDSAASFRIKHDDDAWWIGYNDEWMGYFPDSLCIFDDNNINI